MLHPDVISRTLICIVNDDFQDIHRPIEEAALVHDRAAVEVLFPVTEQLAHYPNWTVDGIIEYTHSEEYKKMV